MSQLKVGGWECAGLRLHLPKYEGEKKGLLTTNG